MIVPIIVVGIAICLVVVVMFMILPVILTAHSAPERKNTLTVLMRMEISMHGGKWHPVELSQCQCMELGFLSGDPNEYYCYNTKVEMCGRLVRFTQSVSRYDHRFPSVGKYKYAFL